MATKKLTDFIGNKKTDTEIWAKIRSELREDIASAHKLFSDYDGSVALGRLLGLNETARRLAIEKAIAGPFILDPDWLLNRLEWLKEITSVPIQAYDFFRTYLNYYSHAWAEKCKKIIAHATPIAEAALGSAIAEEESFFAEAGLPRQETPLAAGAVRVVEKLKSSAAYFDRILKSPHSLQIPSPDPLFLTEIFEDEITKHAATIAAIASKNDLQA